MKHNDEYYLVLNLGLKSIRCIIFNEKGTVIEQASLKINTFIKDEWVEQSPSEWWEKALRIMRIATETEEVSQKISRVSVTSSSACLVYVDDDGTPLGRGIMVSDKRAQKEADDIAALAEFEDVKKATGLGISAYFQLPKILWLKNHKNKAFKKVNKFLSPNDFLLFKLTGKYITDIFNAQKFHFDYIEHKYPQNLLKKIGIDDSRLPPVGNPSQLIGPINDDLNQRFNFNEVKAYLTTYDAICAFLGSGPIDTSVACDVSGTVTSVRAYTNEEITNDLENIFLTPMKAHDMYIVGGSNNIGGGLIEWLKQAFYSHEKNPYEVMEKEARESTIGGRGLIFLPYLMGERAPVWDNVVRGMFFGIERTHTRRDFARAVFESTAFITADLVNEIVKNGIPVERVRVSGGLARIRFINQIKADVLGMNVEVVENFETTSLGCLALMLAGRKKYDTMKDAIEKIVRIRVVYKPKMEYHEMYKKLFNIYKNIYTTNRPLFDERRSIYNEIYTKKVGTMENL
jgi:xylulokinase